MKIELRIEDGKPIIFFTDEVERDKSINCWTVQTEHATASRAYMRQLEKPVTHDQQIACWRALNHYSNKLI